jgi:zinc-ribbon domain
MSFCTKCGRPLSRAVKYCTHCGAPVPPDTTTSFGPPEAGTAPGQPGTADRDRPAGLAIDHDPFGDLFRQPGGSSRGSPDLSGGAPVDDGFVAAGPQAVPAPRAGSRRNPIIAVLAAVVVLAAGGGAVLWATHRHQAKLSELQTHATASAPASHGTSGASAQPAPSPASSLTPTPAPSLTSAPAATPASNGLVAVAPAIAQDPDAAQVETFLNSYFAAINEHSFRKYRKLLDPALQQRESAQSFRSGYGSTTDSAATLTAISHSGSGVLSAAVTFTSHQLPADSPTDTTCTDWSIVLPLHPQSGRYVLGPAPAGYHAAYQAC